MSKKRGGAGAAPKPKSVQKYQALKKVATPRVRKGMVVGRSSALRQGATVRQADRAVLRMARSAGIKPNASIRKGKVVRKK